MIRVGIDGVIQACYNGMTNSTTGNCGFVVTQPLGFVGVYRINFGFPVSDRFVSITCEYLAISPLRQGGANYRYFDATSIEVFTFAADDANDTSPRSFTLILY
jgi:hypothetical protein